MTLELFYRPKSLFDRFTSEAIQAQKDRARDLIVGEAYWMATATGSGAWVTLRSLTSSNTSWRNYQPVARVEVIAPPAGDFEGKFYAAGTRHTVNPLTLYDNREELEAA
jgi:hypothetical protein